MSIGPDTLFLPSGEWLRRPDGSWVRPPAQKNGGQLLTGPTEVEASTEEARRVIAARAQQLLSGGGAVFWDGSLFSWGTSGYKRFVTIGMAQSVHCPGGHWAIEMPPNGTVIPGYGGTPTKTVTGGRIVMEHYAALYYQIPWGRPYASVPANFRLVGYSGAFNVPYDWLLIAVTNQDGGEPSLKLGTGREQDHWRPLAMQPGWSLYGGFAGALYRKEQDNTAIRGLVLGGAVNTTIASVPAGYFPSNTMIFNSSASGGIARIDVSTGGAIQWVSGGTAGVTSGYMSLDGIFWPSVA